MGWLAERRILFGDDYIEAGDPVPVETGRNYARMESIGEIRWVKDPKDASEPSSPKPPAKQPGAAEPGAGLIEIPADWQKQSWQRLRSLASQVSTDTINNKAEAVKAIEAELARRAAAASESGGTDQRVAIPENWRELDEAARLDLAANFATDLVGVEDADAAIELEIESRKAGL